MDNSLKININITKNELIIIAEIIKNHAGSYTVWAFGSRVNGTHANTQI